MTLNDSNYLKPPHFLHFCRLYYPRSRSRSSFAICCRPTPIRLSAIVSLSSVCQKRSCTLLSRLKFSAIFLWRLVPWPTDDIHRKFYGDRPREPLRLGS